jgi:hypothetical protein
MSDTTPEPRPPSSIDWRLAAFWTLVFAANLPVPILAINIFVAESAWFGLFVGFVTVYWIGVALCGWRYRIGRSLVVGGALLIASQFFPILQVLFATFADQAWMFLGGRDIIDPEGAWENGCSAVENSLGGFIVTFLAAWWMCVIAVVLGAWVRHLWSDGPIWQSKPLNADPDADD